MYIEKQRNYDFFITLPVSHENIRFVCLFNTAAFAAISVIPADPNHLSCYLYIFLFLKRSADLICIICYRARIFEAV